MTDQEYQDALDSCNRNRIASYPPLRDLADALVHANMGDNSKLIAYYATCEAIKAQYPKPTPPGGAQ